MIRPVLPAYLLDTLQAVADGHEGLAVAERLHVAEDTVKGRLRKLYLLLGVNNRAQAVAVGYRLGLLDVKPVPVPDCVLAEGAPLDRLVTAREVRGWSQQQAAARIGRSAAWLCHRETGRRLFPWNELVRYAQVLGVDLDGVCV